MVQRRVTTRKVGQKYVVSYGGNPIQVADTKTEALTKANAKRKSLKRNKR